jgi:hypothetical protein
LMWRKPHLKFLYLGVYALRLGYGRCYNCAGAAVVRLILNSGFDRFDVAVASKSYGVGSDGHYFALVGIKKDGVGEGDFVRPQDWRYAYKVDIWEACGSKHFGQTPRPQSFFTGIDRHSDTSKGCKIEALYEPATRRQDYNTIMDAIRLFKQRRQFVKHAWEHLPEKGKKKVTVG